ncbi:hypothetical protein ASPZODRAFT_137493 [Penicilliopsis zonata CBS 506.65]|uniref:Uncharacterized protein n=1 Tax=Penicilliopsis zonata CBS 506.65 TaxID=1073090 RepID=A0A1L9S4L4_9EURO|nr:hypothetical protein ASPZODRAFT_137493 [Penicilliopsis zonata CBS 506.65]OJJ42107.1 hypothetical protein ASPZODRAFT_137493 [Penicilliopsis zonata CBS 506.65]
MLPELDFRAAVAATAALALGALPAGRRLISARGALRKPSPALYEDADGTASPEALAAFSNRRPLIAVFTAALAGLGVSVARGTLAAITAQHAPVPVPVPDMLPLLAWFLLLIPIVDAARETDPVARFHRALLTLPAAGLVAVVLLAALQTTGSNTPLYTLDAVQLALLAGVVVALGFIQRRPAVSVAGRPVDAEQSSALWARLSFAWAGPVLRAGAAEQLEANNMPLPPHSVRVAQTTAVFDSLILNERLPLWARLGWRFRSSLLILWIAILVSNFFDVAPAFATLQLLKYLERRELDPDTVDRHAWIYVVSILAATVSSKFVDTRIMWWGVGKLVLPLRSTLTGVMYRKMLRRRLVEDANNKDSDNTDEPVGPPKRGSPGGKRKPGDEDGAQDVVNMFAVDCNQIAMFAVQSSQYINLAGKFSVTVVFLWLLMGWQSLAMGLLGIAVLFPINRTLAARYGRKQKILMRIRDRRATIASEMLHGIRQIKFGASEDQWAAQLGAIRDEELAVLWQTRLNNIYMAVASEFTPVVLTAFSLTTYVLVHGSLGPAVAFTAISVFLQLEGLVSGLPFLLVMFINAKVSCDRIDRFLRTPDRPVATHPGPSVAFHNASLAFPTNKKNDNGDDRFVLRDVNLNFPPGKFSVISGPTGSGKSLLLAAILGEADVLAGAVHVPPTAGAGMAFVAQSPWLENATVRDNILFGAEFDAARYGKTVAACALLPDLAMFPDGDDTVIGTQGVTLSGGQKWRVSLARALYSRASVLVLDDVFSALDAHVGRHVLDNALYGELAQGRTRILATHHASMCRPAYSVRLADGRVEFAGVELEEKEEIQDDQEDTGPAFTQSKKVEADVETRSKGRIAAAIYKGYLGASGGPLMLLLIVILFALSQTFVLGRTYWVRIWANAGQEASPRTFNMHTLQTLMMPNDHTVQAASSHSVWFYLGVYCAISGVSVAVTIARLACVYTASLRASRKIFMQMLHSILHAPLRWLDTVPAGRILNRFTGDFNSMDTGLPQSFYALAAMGWELLGILVAAIFVTPWMAIVAVLLISLCVMIAQRYIAAARSIKRIESISKSPVITHFSTTLRGLATIRAFNETAAFTDRMYTMIDQYAACTWHDALLRGWLMLRVGFTSALLAVTTAFCVVSIPGVDAGLAGFALSFALNFSQAVGRSIRVATMAELDMNAAERILEYRDIATEPTDGDLVRASWPEHGRIQVQGLEVGYAEELPTILKGLTFTAEARQRIGVVGRTGAGKSTLSLALFRLLHARQGSIVIDGVDISTIRLDLLRSRLAIIPQDPVLFSGTIRSNLDPQSRYSDMELYDALRRVHLLPSTAPQSDSDSGTLTPNAQEAVNIFLSLDSPIALGGNNLSQGQKQLLCLARAILTRPKILIMDEATSAVDGATDQLIQRSIRESFIDTTLIVVAHRLSTVMDFDRILVMQDGVAAEFGVPEDLKQKEGGVFASMVQQHAGGNTGL